MHLEVRILPEQILDRHERAAVAEREPLFRALVGARAPAAADQRFQRVDRHARAQRRAKIRPHVA